MAAEKFAIRSYQAGDELEIAPLFNAYTARFVGPFLLTPESWLAQCRSSWRGPGLEGDPDCVRVAEREGRIVGYARADHHQPEASTVQELCVTEEEDAGAIAEALLDDAEEIARSRGRLVVLLELSDDDGLVQRVGRECGYEFAAGGAVFMAAITDLARCLVELQPELQRRLAESEFREWRGEVALTSGELAAGLRLASGVLEVASVAHPTITVEISPERLPRLLLGQSTVGDCYLQDELALTAPDRQEALRLLDVLLPRLPIFLPRGQWW